MDIILYINIDSEINIEDIKYIKQATCFLDKIFSESRIMGFCDNDNMNGFKKHIIENLKLNYIMKHGIMFIRNHE